jgi:hypothetical protein
MASLPVYFGISTVLRRNGEKAMIIQAKLKLSMIMWVLYVRQLCTFENTFTSFKTSSKICKAKRESMNAKALYSRPLFDLSGERKSKNPREWSKAAG